MTAKEELTQSQVAEQLRQQTQLLRTLVDHVRDKTPSEALAAIKKTDPATFKRLRAEKITQSSLGDVIETEAQVQGFSTVDAMINESLHNSELVKYLPKSEVKNSQK